jgi:plasmid segregation protein ParM
MDAIVRAIDVGYGNTKYVTQAEGGSIRCAHFASVAPATTGQPGAAPGDKRRTLGIAIGDLTYEVGPDAHLAAEVYQTRQMHDGYCETPEYLALTRGALGFMKLERIDLLVLGLPVATYKTRRASLERRMKAVHPLDKGRSVSVERVRVVAQPQGALMLFGVQNNRIDQINHERNLVIDAGARTFDWLVAQGLRVIEKRSDSANKGMFDVLHSIAEAISDAENTRLRDYERIDAALRAGTRPKIFGKEYDIAAATRAARRIPDEAIGEMLRYVGDGNDIDNIVLVGGAAFFYGPSVRAAFPKHKVHELGDGLYANVKGFQIAGMEIARSFGAGPAGAGEPKIEATTGADS